MFAAEIRRAVEAAPRVKLPEIGALLWRAYSEGQVTEAEAETLTALIEERKAAGRPVGAPRKAVGSRPVSSGGLERRRRWAASGRLPPALAARFTLAEQAVLALVAAETVRRGDCRLAIGHLAAVAGVSETTVRNSLREAKALGFLTVEERRLSAWRNHTNIVRVVSREWIAWLRLARTEAPARGRVQIREGHAYRDLKIPTPSSVEMSQGLPTGGRRPRRKPKPAIGGDDKAVFRRAVR